MNDITQDPDFVALVRETAARVGPSRVAIAYEIAQVRFPDTLRAATLEGTRDILLVGIMKTADVVLQRDAVAA